MRIRVSVIPKSGRQEVKIEEDKLKVWLKSAPADGKANEELMRILADYFDIAKSSVKILSGLSSRNKNVDIVGVSQEVIRKSVK